MENAMCAHDNYVSPYLRRPLRTYEEILREEAERSVRENRSKARAETVPHGPGYETSNDVAPPR